MDMRKPPAISSALRQARRAWRIQYTDSSKSIETARAALSRALETQDQTAEAWALLTLGFHETRNTSPDAGLVLLEKAAQLFEQFGLRRGVLLAIIGRTRAWWMRGEYNEAFETLMPIRDEALRLLAPDERGKLLSDIAGCYSVRGEAAQAFAYLHQGLREASRARASGFDVVLYCNIAHELMTILDSEAALRYANDGLARCEHVNNPRALFVLLLNRMTCLTDLGRAEEAMADVHRILALPNTAAGHGAGNLHLELLAMTALRAGHLDMGASLIERATKALPANAVIGDSIDLVVAKAELYCLRNQAPLAIRELQAHHPLPAIGLGLRQRCIFYAVLANAYERAGDANASLRALREWQSAHIESHRAASDARHQAAFLNTELVRLQRERDQFDARHRAAEKARLELQLANELLAKEMQTVQALQATLQEQAVHDALTGLFNRRHLSAVLPSMLTAAGRDGVPLSVAILDLDRFKAVNDTFGHLVGDGVLKAFAAMLTAELRRGDVVCRYGGEEFCVLMPRTSQPQAQKKIESVLKRWRTTRLDIDGHAIGPCTFSAGVAGTQSLVHAHGATASEFADALLRRADECALQAKRGGRNRVVLLEDESSAR